MNAGRLLLLTLLAGCAGTLETVDESGQVYVFALPERTADRVLFEAMRREFEEAEIESVSSPAQGYSSTVTWGLDRDRITAIMQPARGRSANGALVDGYRFEVTHSGTAPAAGIPAAKRLLQRIVDDASRLTSRMPLVR